MKTRSVFRSTRFLSILGMMLLLSPSATYAKTVTYFKDYRYQASEGDSKLSCRTVAFEQVKRLLLEELGTYLLSETEVKDFELTKDRISSLSAGIVSTVILEEKWDGQTYFLKAQISTDTDELVKLIDSVRRNQEQSSQWEEMRKKTEEALIEIKNLKEEMRKGKEEKVTKEKYAQAVNELSAMDWYKQGYALMNNAKKPEEALKAYDKAIEVDPGFARPYAGRAQTYNESGQFEKAIRESEQALLLDPKLAWAFNTRGVAHNGLRNPEKAIEDLSRAIELDPKYARPHSNRSNSYYWLKNYRQSLKDADKAIELDPRLSSAHFRRGRALASLNETEEAVRSFDRAIQLDPTDSGFYWHRGRVFLKLNKKELAMEDIRKAASMGNNPARDYLRKEGIPW